MIIPWLAGLDLGEVADYSALAIAQRTVQQWGEHAEQHYQVRHLERFPLGTPYGGLCLHGVLHKHACTDCPKGLSIGGIVEQAARLESLPKPHGWEQQPEPLTDTLYAFPIPQRHYHLILDCTGVGIGVANMFRALQYWPILVTITAGNAVTEPEPDEWHVSKRQLVSRFQVALQTRRIKMAPITINHVRMDREVIKEAINSRYKMNQKTGDEQYDAWRNGEHDDLLLATMLPIWYGELEPPPQPHEQRLTHAIATGNPWDRRTA